MSTIDDIKAKIDLTDYLREQGIVLKAAGSSWKACCPFHNEKTPSFMVSREKQVYHCFGCGKGGDLFTFVQEHDGLEFGETLRLLAERAGVTLEARDPRLEGKKTRLSAILDLAAKWFHHQLVEVPSGEIARQYVMERGIAPAIVDQFQIGYAPDTWDSLNTFCVHRGFTVQEIVESGLGIASRRSSPPDATFQVPGSRAYDRFRHRLMFPIHDALGRVVGFTGRILEGGTTVGPAGETPAKYVNTPETALYRKGAILYGLSHAKEAIRNAGHAVLVEGQMDVVACHEAGITQAVATSGTALTSEQLRLLKRSTASLRVAFDADPAGGGAAERGIDAALDAGFDVQVIRMPMDAAGQPIAKDPDACVRKDTEAWRQAVAHPIPIFDFYLDLLRSRFDVRTPAGQRDAGRILVAHLGHVADPIERAVWIRRSADAIGVREDAIVDALRARATRAPVAGVAHRTPPVRTPHPSPISDRLADRFLAALLRAPAVVPALAEVLPSTALPGPERSAVYEQLLACYARGAGGSTSDDDLGADHRGIIERLTLLADHEFPDWSADALREDALRCARAIRREQITVELRLISGQLAVVERASGTTGASPDLVALSERVHLLTTELAMLH